MTKNCKQKKIKSKGSWEKQKDFDAFFWSETHQETHILAESKSFPKSKWSKEVGETGQFKQF